MPRTAKPEVSTAEYVRSHGREPRGSGRWAFFFDGDDRAEAAWFAPGQVTFAEARKAAVAEARRRGASRVEVGP